MRKLWGGGILLLSSVLFASTLMTKVIPLHYQMADKVIRLIQPLLSPDERVSGSGQTLIVKVSPETLTSLRTLLHQLDVPPVVFSIKVYQGNPNDLSQMQSSAIVYSTNPRDTRKRLQSVQVISGESALVTTDTDVPVISSVGGDLWSGVSMKRHLVNNGFLLEPTLQGSQVKLKIRRIQARVSPTGGQQFESQLIDTTLMVPLDSWVDVGSSESSFKDTSTSVVYQTGDRFSLNATLFVKVSINKKHSSGIPKE